MSFLRNTEKSVRWLLSAAISFVFMFVLGFWTQGRPEDPIPILVEIGLPLVFILFLCSVVKGISYLAAENEFRKFLGLKSDFDILTLNPETMDYLRPMVTTKMNEIFDQILAFKKQLSSSRSQEESEHYRWLIRHSRNLYEKRRKLVRKFGFEVRSPRKLLKSLRKQKQVQ